MRLLSPGGPEIELTGTERAAQSSTFQPLSPSVSKTYCLKYPASLACSDWVALVEYVNRARGWASCNCATAWFRALDSVRDWPLPAPVPPMPGPAPGCPGPDPSPRARAPGRTAAPSATAIPGGPRPGYVPARRR